MTRSLRRTLSSSLVLAWCAACTSEAELGHWHQSDTAPLSTHDGMPLGPAVPHAGSMAIDPPARIPSPLCLRNPSLDGFPHAGPLAPDTWWPAEAWELCWYAADDYPPDVPETGPRISAVTVVNEATTVDAKDGMPAKAGALPVPAHGVGYLCLDTLLGLPERTSQSLCATLEAGVTYNFAIDVASRAGQRYDGSVIAPGVLEIYGTNTLCGHAGEPLWRSPPITGSWQTLCASFTPTSDVSIVTLQVPASPRAKTAILVDNIRLDQSCGPSVEAPDHFSL